jgi:prevent-host-death family protein
MYISGMSSKYSVAEARAKLPKILDEVELGREVELTRRGKAVAVVVSVEEYERMSGGYRSFAEAYEEHRKRHEGLERSVLEGLRDRTGGRMVQL